ncbi:hypothetical protein HYS92_03130 [Candidatus Daviesbacteria bacterium]|nr:hypothetical protein [Candidatus Daviesbacteria bacterium]
MANTPERQIIGAQISAALLNAKGNIMYTVNWAIISRDSTSILNRSDISEGIQEVQQPGTYFDKSIDWQAGGENPFRAALEEQRQAIMEHPRLLSD